MNYRKVDRLSENNELYLGYDNDLGKYCIVRVVNDFLYDLYSVLKEKNIKNIPKIYEINRLPERKIEVISEYIEGISLYDYIKDKGKLEVGEIVEIATKICDILTDLHSQNPPIIHRDIKGKNIILCPDDQVYLIDFDAGRISSLDDEKKEKDTIRMGTKGYAAPEQFGFGTSVKQSDYYSLGILINTMATGEVSYKYIQNSPLTPIIAKCTRMDPKHRYVSSELIKQELMECEEKYQEAIGESYTYEREGVGQFLRKNLNRFIKPSGWVDEYYCTKCGAVLDEQMGFSPDNKTWICMKCGQLLTNGENAPNAIKFPNIFWYCDGCTTYLNIQEGFTDTEGTWVCTKCGFVNKIDISNIR